MMKADQERVSKLLSETVMLLCKNGLIYKDEIKIQGLLGITLDKTDIFIVHFNETVGNVGAKNNASDGTGKIRHLPAISVVDLTTVADSPAIQAPVRGIGPVVPGLSQPVAVGSRTGSGGIGARKQRPLMPQMMPRSQHLSMQRFRGGMFPTNAHVMANSHAMCSRQLGNLAAMQQMQHRLPLSQLHAAPSRHQQVQLPGTVALDDDEDVVIIGTGHEEPSPNWNSSVRKNHQSQTDSRQLSSANHAKSVKSISLKESVAVSDVAPAEPNIAATVSLIELPGESIDRPQLISIMNESTVEDLMETIDMEPVVNSEMLIEPNNLNSGGDSVVGDKILNEKLLIEMDAADDSNTNENYSSELEIDSNVYQDTLNKVTTLSSENISKTDEDDSVIISHNSMIPLTEREQLSGTSQQMPLPTVYTDIADGQESFQLEGVQVTDMDMHTIDFDILKEVDHGISQPPSQLSLWNCKLSGCKASFADASSLASHYELCHTDRLELLASPCTVSHAANSSASEGSDPDSTDGAGYRRHRAMCCPFAGCHYKFSSWPGLNLHHKKSHGAPISKTERMKILAMCGKQLECSSTPVGQKSRLTKLSQHIMKVHEFPEGMDTSIGISTVNEANSVGVSASDELRSSVPVESDPSTIKNFLCLASNCEVICSSREALIEHMQTCHGNINASYKGPPLEVKEETIEDQ